MSGHCDFCGIWHSASCFHPGRALLAAATQRAERAEAEREEARAANATRPDYDLRCGGCGRAHILDTVIPSEDWNAIAPDGGVLCSTCIDARLKAAGRTAEAEFYYCGDALFSRAYEMSMGDLDYFRRQVEKVNLAAIAQASALRAELADARATKLSVDPATGTIEGALPCGHPSVVIDHRPGDQRPFCAGCSNAAQERTS